MALAMPDTDGCVEGGGWGRWRRGETYGFDLPVFPSHNLYPYTRIMVHAKAKQANTRARTKHPVDTIHLAWFIQLNPSPLHLTYHRDVQAASLGIRLGRIKSSLAA